MERKIPENNILDWVISGCVLDHVVGWRNWFGKHYSEVWNLVPSCVMWFLWRERNKRTFEDVELSVDKLIESCMYSLFEWFRAWGFTTSLSIGGFLEGLALVKFLVIKKKKTSRSPKFISRTC